MRYGGPTGEDACNARTTWIESTESIVLAVVMLATGIGIGMGAMATAQSNTVYYACVGNSGNVKMVKASETCKKNENRIEWNQRGPQGLAGPAGADGADGADGTDGTEGPQGPIGATGAQGPLGQPGSAGSVGPAGADGVQGPAGPAGNQGVPGPQGAVGPTGAQGEPGIVSLSTLEGTACSIGSQAGTIGITTAASGVVTIQCQASIDIDIRFCRLPIGGGFSFGTCYEIAGFPANDTVTALPMSYTGGPYSITTDTTGTASGFLPSGIPCRTGMEVLRLTWAGGALSRDIEFENLGCGGY